MCHYFWSCDSDFVGCVNVYVDNNNDITGNVNNDRASHNIGIFQGADRL